MSRYTQLKLRAREEAIAWQSEFSEHSYSYSELEAFADHFETQGKRYGLLTEFRENGVI